MGKKETNLRIESLLARFNDATERLVATVSENVTLQPGPGRRGASLHFASFPLANVALAAAAAAAVVLIGSVSGIGGRRMTGRLRGDVHALDVFQQRLARQQGQTDAAVLPQALNHVTGSRFAVSAAAAAAPASASR